MEHSASAQRARSAAQRLDRNLLFQIFDYVRDGRAFLQCEATCTDFHSLLREESGIGQKLWQARPIAYGARVFATGGTAQNAARMYRGGRRPGSGVEKGDKHGTYSKKAATKQNSTPTDASKVMLARGKDEEAPQDGHDGGAPAAAAVHQLHVDDKCKVRANDGGAVLQLAADTRGTCALDHDHGIGGGEGA